MTNEDVIPYIRELLPQDFNTVLSLGCGNHDSAYFEKSFREKHDILLAIFPDANVTGIDLWQPAIEYRGKFGPPGSYHVGDVVDFPKICNYEKFDIIICHHVIEHLPRLAGEYLKVICEMYGRTVIFGAPNGFVASGYEENPHMEHLSGWTVHDFPGYKTTFNGEVFVVGKTFE